MPPNAPPASNSDLYRSLLHANPSPIYIIDPEGRIVDLNDAGAQRLKRPREELLGIMSYSLFPPSLQASRRAAVTRVFDTGVAVSFEDEREGRVMRSIVFPVGPIGSRPSAVGVLVLDLTEQLQKERALAAALARVERLESIVNRSPVMVFLWRDDPAYPVEYASKNVSQLGYSAEDFTEGRVSWLAITHPDDVPRLEAELEHHIREGHQCWTQRYRLKTADGQWRWFEDNTRPVRDPAGRITHFEATVTDITDCPPATPDRLPKP